MTLKVGIVGSGIAGLSAAIGLRRAGAEVEIFEQSEFKNETGAAITVTPNGTRVLDAWGFDHERAQATENLQIKQALGGNLELFQSEDLSGVPDDFGGHKFLFFHRADLHTELRELAIAPPGDKFLGVPVKIGLKCKVVNIDCQAASITLENGEVIVKDLLVIADGVKSPWAPTISQTDKPLVRAPRSAFRTLIPMEVIHQEPELDQFWKDEPHGYYTFFNGAKLGNGEIVVSYPCRNATLLNLAILHNNQPEDEGKEGWHEEAAKSRVMSVLQDFHPKVHKLVSLAPEFQVHKLMLRDPLETLVRAKTVIVGDAGHPMYPTHAQGAVLAMEEGAALEVLFRGVDKDQVSQRLQLYNQLILPHAQVVQVTSNFGSHELAAQIIGKKRPLYPEGSQYYGPEVRKYFYSFDIVKEANHLLESSL